MTVGGNMTACADAAKTEELRARARGAQGRTDTSEVGGARRRGGARAGLAHLIYVPHDFFATAMVKILGLKLDQELRVGSERRRLSNQRGHDAAFGWQEQRHGRENQPIFALSGGGCRAEGISYIIGSLDLIKNKF